MHTHTHIHTQITLPAPTRTTAACKATRGNHNHTHKRLRWSAGAIMREHCCDPLTAALITAQCSVSTLGVNTREHQHCGDLTIHNHVRAHARTHTHTEAGTPCIQRRNHRAGTWMTHCAFLCVSLVGCSPTCTTFPRSPSVFSKDKARPCCPQLISSSRERDKQHICAHIHTQT